MLTFYIAASRLSHGGCEMVNCLRAHSLAYFNSLSFALSKTIDEIIINKGKVESDSHSPYGDDKSLACNHLFPQSHNIYKKEEERE